MVDRRLDRHPLPRAVEAAFRGGADWLQLRERRLEGAEWLAWAEALADAARRGARHGPPLVLVNRRLDVALALGAGGAHLGFDAVAPADARALLGAGARIGASCHHADEVAAAARAGLVDYVHLAPIHAPLSKPASKPASRPPLGAGALAAAARHGLPVIAQGGLTAAHAADAVAAGAAGVAVTGAVLAAADPERESAALRDALDAGARRRSGAAR